jgi:LuxR family maltose regulon positive regulatory protein
MLMHTNQLDAAETYLQEAEQALPDLPQEQARQARGLILATRANISFYRGTLPSCVAFGRQALGLLPETPGLARAAATVFAAHSFLLTGDVTPAADRGVAAVAAGARAAGNRGVVLRGLTLLAELQAFQGRLRTAAATYHEAAQLASEPGELMTMIGSAGYYFGLGDLYREWNDLAAAEQHLLQGMDQVSGALTANALYLGQGSIALARLQHAQGDPARALETLATFADTGRQRGFDALLLARGAAVQAQLRLMQHDLDAAWHWADSSGLHPGDDISFPREREYLMLARVLVARGRGEPAAPFLDDALSLLDRMLVAAEAGERMDSAIEIFILRALALAAQGDTPGALVALERALGMAASEGYVRIFLDEGLPMAALLAQSVERSVSDDSIRIYAEHLLSAFSDVQSTERRAQNSAPFALRSTLERSNALVEPLTDRELEILRLIAEGHSNQAIADTLIIAVSTVKRHINNIYGKLDVQSRTQALVRARELQLL